MSEIYDNEVFFRKYSRMARSEQGLSGAGEWPTLRELLPNLAGKRVLDLGCGYGWHCFYALEQGAIQVVGTDVSRRMLEVARRKDVDGKVDFRLISVEEYDYPAGAYDVVLSSLVLHYVEDLDSVFRKVYATLAPGGHFIFTIEHPIFTAEGKQDWHYEQGVAVHWPVDRYFEEGIREACFLGERVTKYHHTLTSLLGGMLRAGFILDGVVEPQPTAEMLQSIKEMKDELRRPTMLIVSGKK